MIPLVLDMGLPRRAASDLRAHGWDVVHVAEIGLATATDVEIIDEARRRGACVVTRDHDFAAEVAKSGADLPSVITARVSLRRAEAVELLVRLVPAICDELIGGALVSVTSAGVRVRALPVGP